MKTMRPPGYYHNVIAPQLPQSHCGDKPLIAYIHIYIYICIYVIQGKNKQHFNKNISATAFINSCQRLQFIHNAYNYEIPKIS